MLTVTRFFANEAGLVLVVGIHIAGWLLVAARLRRWWVWLMPLSVSCAAIANMYLQWYLDFAVSRSAFDIMSIFAWLGRAHAILLLAIACVVNAGVPNNALQRTGMMAPFKPSGGGPAAERER